MTLTPPLSSPGLSGVFHRLRVAVCITRVTDLPWNKGGHLRALPVPWDCPARTRKAPCAKSNGVVTARVSLDGSPRAPLRERRGNMKSCAFAGTGIVQAPTAHCERRRWGVHPKSVGTVGTR
jgi:hypothetical protein